MNVNLRSRELIQHSVTSGAHDFSFLGWKRNVEFSDKSKDKLKDSSLFQLDLIPGTAES